jgi:hypothetical protein
MTTVNDSPNPNPAMVMRHYYLSPVFVYHYYYECRHNKCDMSYLDLAIRSPGDPRT